MIIQRTTSLLAILAVVACALFILSKSTNTTLESVSHVQLAPSRYIPTKIPSFDDLRHPFRPAAHEPPEQAHSTSGESKWFSDWKWLNPFSSSITLDEHRTVLPPLPDRPPVYTFYEPNPKNDKEQEKADGQLLLAWRRAWYAKGFRPVVLSRAEAMKNPLYEEVQRRQLEPELETDFLKWLAWGHMGSGLLADWQCFPMARYDDPIFTYLRAGAIPTHITRFDTLDRALFAGEKARINDAIKFAIQDPSEHNSTILSAIPAEFFKIEQSNALAYYHPDTVKSNYPKLAEKYDSQPAAARQALAKLIDAHLHAMFLNSIPTGFTVLKPFPDYTTALVEPAINLARALSKCPDSDLPQSCPPNHPNCQPCNSKFRSVPIVQRKSFANDTDTYTIGVLPHPLTLITLQRGSEEVDIPYIRRETARDPWLAEVTSELVGPKRGGSARVVAFKEVVAGEQFASRTFWMTVETLLAQPGENLPSTLVSELEWHFGFNVESEDDEGARKIQGNIKAQPALLKEYELIEKAREWLRKQANRVNLRNIAEAWNLADIEVWRFVQAYRARSVVERKRWEEEEQKFLGARVD